jgi:hypothetical protein
MFQPTGSAPKDRAICGSAVTMMVLPRFSMNSAAATRAAICMARRCRSGSSSLRTREIKVCWGLLFDCLVISSAVCLWESAARRIALQHGSRPGVLAHPSPRDSSLSRAAHSWGQRANPRRVHGRRFSIGLHPPNARDKVKIRSPTSPPTSVPLIRIYCRSLPTCSSSRLTSVAVSQLSTTPAI